MVSNLQYQSDNPALEYLSFSKAYLNAAAVIADSLTKIPARFDYQHAATVAFNTRLGVELFLKAAIIKKNSDFKKMNHSINTLAIEYRKLYGGEIYFFEVPFETKFVGFEFVDDKILKNSDEQHPTDQVLRYPRHKSNRHWTMIMAFLISGLAQQT